MLLESKCRCGAEFSMDFYDNSSRWGAQDTFKKWLDIHTPCKDKQFIQHLPFKHRVERNKK